MSAPVPPAAPAVTIARTREDGYQLLRMFVLAAGAEESDGALDLLPAPCGEEADPRQRADGYYRMVVLGGFRAVGDDQHRAFAGMYDFALRNRFRVRAYRNPATGTHRPGAVGEWELKGVADGRDGFAFSVFTVRPQTHVAVWITSSCRRTPDPDEPDGPFVLPSLVAHVPRTAPVWAPRPPAAEPHETAAEPQQTAGTASRPASAPATRPPDAGTLARIRDLLG